MSRLSSSSSVPSAGNRKENTSFAFLSSKYHTGIENRSSVPMQCM